MGRLLSNRVTVDGFCMLSRRRWDMTRRYRSLRSFPSGLILDGFVSIQYQSTWYRVTFHDTH